MPTTFRVVPGVRGLVSTTPLTRARCTFVSSFLRQLCTFCSSARYCAANYSTALLDSSASHRHAERWSSTRASALGDTAIESSGDLEFCQVMLVMNSFSCHHSLNSFRFEARRGKFPSSEGRRERRTSCCRRIFSAKEHGARGNEVSYS